MLPSYIDLFLIAFILCYTLYGLRRGLVLMLSRFVGSIAACTGAFIGAKFLAKPVAGLFIKPLLSGKLEELAQNAASLPSGAQSPEELWNGLSSTVKGLVTAMGQQKDAILSAPDPVEAILSAIQGNLAESIAFCIVFLLLFFILTMLIDAALHTLDIAINLVLLGPVNALLGAAAGFVISAAVCCLLVWALPQFAPSLFLPSAPLAPENLKQTVLTQFIMEHKPAGLWQAPPA